MTVIRQTTEELAVNFPLLAEDLPKRGVVATVELFSENCSARALLYENCEGGTVLVYGSRALHDRYKKQSL